jgi:hypothetical protein
VTATHLPPGTLGHRMLTLRRQAAAPLMIMGLLACNPSDPVITQRRADSGGG